MPGQRRGNSHTLHCSQPRTWSCVRQIVQRHDLQQSLSTGQMREAVCIVENLVFFVNILYDCKQISPSIAEEKKY